MHRRLKASDLALFHKIYHKFTPISAINLPQLANSRTRGRGSKYQYRHVRTNLRNNYFLTKIPKKFNLLTDDVVNLDPKVFRKTITKILKTSDLEIPPKPH